MNTQMKVAELQRDLKNQREILDTLFKFIKETSNELDDTKIELVNLSDKMDMLLKYQNLEIRDEPASKYIAAKKETK